MEDDVNRTNNIIKMFVAGNTLQAIGRKYNISRERVRQILAKHRISGKDGGTKKKTADRINRRGKIPIRDRSAAEDRVATRNNSGCFGFEAKGYCRLRERCPKHHTGIYSGEEGRSLSKEAALTLKDATGVTLDWLFDGDPRGLPPYLSKRLNA